ncbi:UNVERIFIED_CONTAM: hypothetical protein RMT77_003370 [Armadillidium vulgare]
MCRMMLTPRSETEISSEWLCDVIKNYERRKTSEEINVEVLSFDVKKGTNPGENFNSELISVVVKTKNHTKNDEDEEMTYNFLLKLHSRNLFSKEMNRLCKTNIRELDIYSKVHPKLTEIQNKLGEGNYELKIPELIYGINDGEDFVIVMRNLKSVGYVLNDKTLGLNPQQLKLAVNQIARWHALSYIYNQKFNLLQEFPILNSGIQSMELFFTVIEFALRSIYPLFKDRDDWKDFFQRLKNKKEILRKMRRNAIPSKTKIPNSIYCLIHSDFWNNNLLFKYENETDREERNPTDVSVIDWQMCHWNRAVIDLHYLLHTSTTYEVRKACLDDILKEYYKTFDEITNRCSTPVPGLTFESFKTDFEESSIVGFCYGLCLSQGTLSKAGEKINRPTSPSSNVRGASSVMKAKMMRLMASLTLNPSFTFLLKAAMKKMLGPVRVEIEEKNNEILINRLTGLIQEAIDKGTLNDIKPVKS